MDRVNEIISDEEIKRVHSYSNFGTVSMRDVVNYGILKCACGHYQGHTSTQIIKEHGLITDEYKLTPKGRMYLWAAFGNDLKV